MSNSTLHARFCRQDFASPQLARVRRRIFWARLSSFKFQVSSFLIYFLLGAFAGLGLMTILLRHLYTVIPK